MFLKLFVCLFEYNEPRFRLAVFFGFTSVNSTIIEPVKLFIQEVISYQKETNYQTLN